MLIRFYSIHTLFFVYPQLLQLCDCCFHWCQIANAAVLDMDEILNLQVMIVWKVNLCTSIVSLDYFLFAIGVEFLASTFIYFALLFDLCSIAIRHNATYFSFSIVLG
jgi:hypothetical protein